MFERAKILLLGLSMPAFLALSSCPPAPNDDSAADDDSAAGDDDAGDDDVGDDDSGGDDDNMDAYGCRTDDGSAPLHPEFLRGLRAA